MKNKVLRMMGWLLGTAGFFGLLATSYSSSQKVRFTQWNVEVSSPQGQRFLTSADVYHALELETLADTHSLLSEINIRVLEETIDNHPFVAASEVFSSYTGEVVIRVVQKRAIARVINQDQTYYLDQNGGEMPLSQHFTAGVPLVTGETDNAGIARFLALYHRFVSQEAKGIRLTGVHVDESERLTAYTNFGRHKIHFGKAEKLDKKMENLLVFYRAKAETEDFKEIESINLAFDGQVVVKRINP